MLRVYGTVLTCRACRVEVHQAPIQGDADYCEGPDCAEQVDHGVSEVGVWVMQQAGVGQELHKPGADQEEPDEDPLGAHTSHVRLRWRSASWACNSVQMIAVRKVPSSEPSKTP